MKIAEKFSDTSPSVVFASIGSVETELFSLTPSEAIGPPTVIHIQEINYCV